MCPCIHQYTHLISSHYLKNLWYSPEKAFIWIFIDQVHLVEVVADPLDLAQRSRFAWACKTGVSMATASASPCAEAIYPPWQLGPQLRFSWRLETRKAAPGGTADLWLDSLWFLGSCNLLTSFIRSFVPSFVRSLFTHLLTPSHTSFITNFMEFSFERFSTYLNAFRAIFSRLKRQAAVWCRWSCWTRHLDVPNQGHQPGKILVEIKLPFLHISHFYLCFLFMLTFTYYFKWVVNWRNRAKTVKQGYWKG